MFSASRNTIRRWILSLLRWPHACRCGVDIPWDVDVCEACLTWLPHRMREQFNLARALRRSDPEYYRQTLQRVHGWLDWDRAENGEVTR